MKQGEQQAAVHRFSLDHSVGVLLMDSVRGGWGGGDYQPGRGADPDVGGLLLDSVRGAPGPLIDAPPLPTGWCRRP